MLAPKGPLPGGVPPGNSTIHTVRSGPSAVSGARPSSKRVGEFGRPISADAMSTACVRVIFGANPGRSGPLVTSVALVIMSTLRSNADSVGIPEDADDDPAGDEMGNVGVPEAGSPAPSKPIALAEINPTTRMAMNRRSVSGALLVTRVRFTTGIWHPTHRSGLCLDASPQTANHIGSPWSQSRERQTGSSQC